MMDERRSAAQEELALYRRLIVISSIFLARAAVALASTWQVQHVGERLTKAIRGEEADAGVRDGVVLGVV